MAYSYKPSSRVVHSVEEEAHSSSLPSTAVEHRFDIPDLNDPDEEEEDSSQLPQLSIGLLIALTCGLGGLQLVWSALFAHGSAYLFYLGITKSQSSLIWATAPISGAVVQPIVGAMADHSRSRWGRRQPLIIGGAIGIVISLTALAWIQNIVGVLAMIFSVQSNEVIEIMVQIGTIISVTLLTISIQPLSLGFRALMVDVCPPEQQSIASAWAARFTGVGNISGYVLGSLSLGVDNEAWRFRILSLISAVVLAITVFVAAYFFREDNSEHSTHDVKNGMFLLRALRNVMGGWSSMLPQSRRVCWVQFYTWMGRFGFLFYSTAYIAHLYYNQSRQHGVEISEVVEDDGTRLGSFANLLSAIVALITQVVAPHIASSNSSISPTDSTFKSRLLWWRQTHIIWAVTQLLFVLCTMLILFISSPTPAIVLITVTGISWGVTGWAPYALLGEEISAHQLENTPVAIDDEDGNEPWVANQSGAMMGVHNAFISVPQILAAVVSSFIFLLCEGKPSGEDDGIAWVLRISGIPSLVAAYLAWRLK